MIFKLSTKLFFVFFGLLLFSIIIIDVSVAKEDEKACKIQVTVSKGDTLFSLCRKHLGKFDQSILGSVLRNNPKITNPNLVYPGQRICLALPDNQKFENIKVPIEERVSPPKTTKIIKDFTAYPSPAAGKITRLKWLDDNTAIVSGQIYHNSICRFFVHVPGDLEYEQPLMERPTPDTFRVQAVIGRKGRDYGESFILKLALFNTMEERTGEIRKTFIRKPHKPNNVVILDDSNEISMNGSTGWAGIYSWMKVQEYDANALDNAGFKINRGRVVTNYRYLGYNPDERYLSWYGRVTLYGSSCLAKALLLIGDYQKAQEILRVWAHQMSPDGKVPRSANVIGDNYISPDVRTGEIAHFLGALAMAKRVTGSKEWDTNIRKIVSNYLLPLTDPETGLIRGGYNGIGSQGYSRPLGYEAITWSSAEHNFDLFQSLVLLHRIYGETEFGIFCKRMASQISQGIDSYLWNPTEGTFNRGWRPVTGPDKAMALDCSSWGALYWLKKARIAKEDRRRADQISFISNARKCLLFAEKHFKSSWNYQTPNGRSGTIYGYRPYDGIIEDLRYEGGEYAGALINWRELDDMVWSEGTLGVAVAWKELFSLTGDAKSRSKYKNILREMIELQTLSDKGGMLYSTFQIEGHFTMGEELASLSWLGYLNLPFKNGEGESANLELVRWMPW